jgi:tetratricopeptide (TPR) repeat protein
MNTQAILRQKAILAAKKGAWDQAVAHNLSLLEIDSKDTGALNRLGVAYLQLHKPKLAREQFQKTLEIDRTNKIAKKHLDKIKNKQAVITPAFVQQHFIEEPGKTKTVALHRLASKDVLESITVGATCELKNKNRYISVSVNGKYVGSLPEDLSFRLTKLIDTGNTYICAIRSCCNKSCEVYIREKTRSKKNANTHSFPPNKIALNSLTDDLDERFVFEENIPVQIVDVDRDFEKTIEDFSTDEVIEP